MYTGTLSSLCLGFAFTCCSFIHCNIVHTMQHETSLLVNSIAIVLWSVSKWVTSHAKLCIQTLNQQIYHSWTISRKQYFTSLWSLLLLISYIVTTMLDTRILCFSFKCASLLTALFVIITLCFFSYFLLKFVIPCTYYIFSLDIFQHFWNGQNIILSMDKNEDLMSSSPSSFTELIIH